jgi:hypothetical protein
LWRALCATCSTVSRWKSGLLALQQAAIALFKYMAPKSTEAEQLACLTYGLRVLLTDNPGPPPALLATPVNHVIDESKLS